ncbi:MAG: hypothetical protein RDV48_13310 [Candidatus Eremiobacteraeota bacterium]|nr:hypothetical protein [Candidatus Eremiobacteraeota bacterium]
MEKKDSLSAAGNLPLYDHLLSSIRYIKYQSFPDMDESRPQRTPITKIKEMMEKEGKAPIKEDQLKLVVSDIISQRFQSNLIKYKMLQQQELLRGMATGGISPEEAILLLLDQTSGEELEEKVLSKGKVSNQSLDELYKFYSRIGENIEKLVQRKLVPRREEKLDDSPFFRE